MPDNSFTPLATLTRAPGASFLIVQARRFVLKRRSEPAAVNLASGLRHDYPCSRDLQKEIYARVGFLARAKMQNSNNPG